MVRERPGVENIRSEKAFGTKNAKHFEGGTIAVSWVVPAQSATT